MTKDQEIALLHSWIAQSPIDSYLVGMLRNLAVQFENDTRSDFMCMPELHAIERQVLDSQTFLAGVEKEIDAKKRALAEVESKTTHAKRALETVRTTAHDLADKLRLL